MPPRPSRNLDRALLAAGRELYATRGCAALSIREVAEAAGVNLGMFHYHFKTREAFLRAVLQGVYEEMYSELLHTGEEAAAAASPLERLRAAMRFMGRFVRANRPVLSRLLADAMCRDPIALDFVRENFPRHLGLIQGLIAAAQEAGQVRPGAAPQLMGFCAGSLAAPIVFGGAVIDLGEVSAARARGIERDLLSDAAIDERIDLALGAISLPPARMGRAAAARRRPGTRTP